MKRWLYYGKIQTGGSWLAVVGGLAILLWLLLADHLRLQPGGPRRIEDAYGILELFLPLALGFLMARLPVLEKSAGVVELCLTYRQPAWVRLLEQALVCAAIWAVIAGLTALIIDRQYVTLGVRDFVLISAPPAVALGGAAVAGSALSRSQVGGVLAAGAWWSIDLLAAGLNPIAYLFNHFQPMSDFDPTVMLRRLILAGAVGLVLALVLAERRSHWISGS